jgi:hypothetical protein
MLSKERWSLSSKPPRRDLLLILLLLLGLGLVKRGWRHVDIFTVFVVLIEWGVNGYVGKANWAGFADEICTQFFLVRLPFQRVGELIDADIGGSGILKSLNPGEAKVSGSGALEHLGFLRRSMILSRSDTLSLPWL